MAKQNDHPFTKDATPMQKGDSESGESRAEKYGALIFLGIAISVISIAVLYESCMY